MIVYQLKCSGNHEFEAWFKDSAAYTTQAADGDISCPYCSDTKVSKAMMAPNISPSRSKAAVPAEAADVPTDAAEPSKEDPAPSKPDVPVVVDKAAEVRALEVAEKILEAVDTLRKEVEANFDNVGDQFANEARRIHYGEADERGIFGEASEEEAEELDEEGIDIYRLPGRPRRN